MTKWLKTMQILDLCVVCNIFVVFAELFCFANACCCHHYCCLQTRENFNETRDKTESLMKKMLEVRQTVNTST